MGKIHPCDTGACDRECFDCALRPDESASTCLNLDCAYEYEGLCMLGVYAHCKAQKGENE
ncbi:hypothetical protein [uncultured Flavonifractor sp.]|uniref:hypothetical protein n=1 Tax=uncultured Flavonifractor sp. TaxID=1193534 RepID=UPI002598E775|nr:hypothetical protein [uncultured Flavonifractor sp.]